jgi:hypothetical protein
MATLRRRSPLPMVPPVVCPAAAPIAGVTPERAGVICRVMAQDREREAGEGMNPAQLAVAREGGDGDVVLTVKGDPSTIERLCCGDALPVLDAHGHPGGRDSYTYCPVWQAEKLRVEEGRRMLKGGGLAPEPDPPVAHFDDGRGHVRETPVGSTWAAEDPWAQGRRDLDILAPER